MLYCSIDAATAVFDDGVVVVGDADAVLFKYLLLMLLLLFLLRDKVVALDGVACTNAPSTCVLVLSVLKGITSLRSSSVQSSTSRPVTGKVQLHLIGCFCDNLIDGTRRDGHHVGRPRCGRLGPEETVDMWDQHTGCAS